MIESKKGIPLAEAAYEVELASRRLALLHLAFAKTLVQEFGPSKGKQLVAKAIKAYGRMIGEQVRKDVLAQGLEPTPENYGVGTSRSLPNIGMHERVEEVEAEGKKRLRAYGCVMARVWNEYGENELGRLYCYVDPAKYMAYNPDYKLAHAKVLPGGDAYCEFCIRPTSAKERADFASEDVDWLYIDYCGEKDKGK